MHNANWQEILSAALVIFVGLKRWATNIYRIVMPVVIQLDQLTVGTTINKDERKKLAMQLIADAQAKGNIKVGMIGNFILGRAVDFIAGKLPDLTVTAQTKADLDELVK